MRSRHDTLPLSTCRQRPTLLLVAACLVACSSRAPKNPADASSSEMLDGPMSQCGAECVGLKRCDDLEKTPRADKNIELMAMAVADSVVAPDDIYSRLSADIAAIRLARPDIAHVRFFARHDGQTLAMMANPETRMAMESGTYVGWECLHRAYKVDRVDFSEPGVVVVHFAGVYNLPLVLDQYAALEGVKSPIPFEWTGADNPTICVTRESESWQYVVRDAGGDCPAGCTWQKGYFFTSSSAASVRFIASWDPQQEPTPPAWWTKYGAGRDSTAVCFGRSPI